MTTLRGGHNYVYFMISSPSFRIHSFDIYTPILYFNNMNYFSIHLSYATMRPSVITDFIVATVKYKSGGTLHTPVNISTNSQEYSQILCYENEDLSPLKLEVIQTMIQYRIYTSSTIDLNLNISPDTEIAILAKPVNSFANYVTCSIRYKECTTKIDKHNIYDILKYHKFIQEKN